MPEMTVHNPGPWPGSWVIAVECLCNASRDTPLESVHYIYGPFPTQQAAETQAATMTWGRATHVFRLWPHLPGRDPGPKGAAEECSTERSRAPDRQPVAPVEGRAWETPATRTV